MPWDGACSRAGTTELVASTGLAFHPERHIVTEDESKKRGKRFWVLLHEVV
jgi:hypothetical protein